MEGSKKILDERRSVDDPGWLGGALATTGCVVVLVVPDLAVQRKRQKCYG